MAKRPVFAIDCDGVLVDNAPYWDRYFAQRYCGTKHPVVYNPFDWDRYAKLCETCWHYVLHSPDMLYTMPPRTDAQYVLPILAKQFDLWLVTSRPESTAEFTNKWLCWNGLSDCFVGSVFTQKKREVCESLGAVALLDDSSVTIESLEDSSVIPIAWNFPYNTHLAAPFRVSNWSEAAQVMISLAAGCVPDDEAA